MRPWPPIPEHFCHSEKEPPPLGSHSPSLPQHPAPCPCACLFWMSPVASVAVRFVSVTFLGFRVFSRRHCFSLWCGKRCTIYSPLCVPGRHATSTPSVPRMRLSPQAESLSPLNGSVPLPPWPLATVVLCRASMNLAPRGTSRGGIITEFGIGVFHRAKVSSGVPRTAACLRISFL